MNFFERQLQIVFDGNARLTGRTVDVVVEDASAFTLFGSVVTSERVGLPMI